MDQLATVVLRRTGRVTVIGGGQVPSDGAAWLTALEADLAGRGWVIDIPLREAAKRLPVSVRVRWADWLLAVLDEETGADRPLVPLYRSFPDTPRDPGAVFVRRLLTHLFAVPGAPCVLCGQAEIGSPLDPCGHPVCPSCFPPSQVSGCPVCGRRLTAGNTYLTPVAPPATSTRRSDRPALLGEEIPPVRIAGLVTDPFTTAVELRDQLVARPGALNQSDRADLRALVAVTAPGSLDWLPEVVPSRETQALLIAWALEESPSVIDAARARWTTVTDVARTLWALSGGDPGLLLDGAPRIRPLSRPLRRAVLAHLDARGPVNAAEDMLRHPTVWKRLGERLHPHEKVQRHPAAAVAFAALRGTRTARTGPLGRAILAHDADQLELLTYRDGTVQVRLRSHAALVEEALTDGDLTEALRLLTQRPGDLWRRLDHVLRTAGDLPSDLALVIAAVVKTASRVAPGVLGAAAAQLAGRDTTAQASPADVAAVRRTRAASLATRRARAATAVPLVSGLGAALHNAGISPGPALPATDTPPSPTSPGAVHGGESAHRDNARTLVGGRPGPAMPRRIFFPKGGLVTTWTEPETRAPLPTTAIEAVRTLVDDELIRRAAALPRFDLAILDARLAEVPAPVRERAGSAQLAGWPRGSVREFPKAGVLRLFLHWEEPEKTRVDLDLSCAFFGADWQRAGYCDYTNLRFAGDAAIHSGDLTSAPAPLGATEFLDLDIDLLTAAGARFAVPIIFSFNAVPFEELPSAIAGLMLPLRGGEQFDAARVAQRFDLQGDARMMMPFVVDLERRRLLWTDLTLPGTAEYYDVGRFGDQLARAAADQHEHFLGGHRTTVLDVLSWHAAARADRVVVVHADGTQTEVPPSPAAIRAAAELASGGSRGVPVTEKVALAGVVDAGALEGWAPGPGSVALTVTGRPGSAWAGTSTIDLLGELPPASN